MDAPRVWFSVCNECNSSIEQRRVPKFSIANGFFIGTLEKKIKGPHTVRFTTQLVSIVALNRVMRGGRHRCIISYCIAFDSSPGPPILLLPRSIEYVASFRVVLVGEFTPSPSSKVRKMHRIRNLKTVEDNTGGFEQGMNKEQQNVCGGTNASCVMSEKDESYVMERRIGLSECSAPAMAQTHPVTTNSEDQCERHFEVRRSDKLANDPTGDIFARMFPHLFFFWAWPPRGAPRSFRIPT
ncbi:hypothetical protein JG687_00008372 [Phytophthora cactorum]|uniref:Uncharacterized protein n=1 Tax=Phytophthora cactorum TaxID=29920 RepID=A0A8T1UCK0_9STRA|nr:hypothetical protein JG687_00008372 [Phytophthora cactorum]